VAQTARKLIVLALMQLQALTWPLLALLLARTIAFAGGPALGGLLVGWAGPIAAFGSLRSGHLRACWARC
jgi:hypothetical protein